MDQPTVSMKTLIRASLAAIVVAGTVLVTIILPAEYNLDPTGLGATMGLTILAESAETEKEANTEANTEANAEEGIQSRYQVNPVDAANEQVIEVTVPAGRGIEYKFYMAQYEKLTYEWLTDGDALYFDLHGEPEGDTSGYFESYVIATASEMKGSFTAPFAGSHGWYWKNTSDAPINVQLMVKGQFKVIGLKP
jgi:hypothetical protein